MKKVDIKHISNLNEESLKGLDFYLDELKIMQERLDEIAAKNTGDDVVKKIDQFQDELIIHKGAIEQLESSIRHNTHYIKSELINGQPFVDAPLATEHDELNDAWLTEEKMINGLRHEFNRFAAEWM
jgi:hypothetical protein